MMHICLVVVIAITTLLTTASGFQIELASQKPKPVEVQIKAPEPPQKPVEPVKVETAPIPEPEPVVAPTAPRQAIGCVHYQNLVAQYGWDTRTALAVMQAESGCNPGAISHTCDRGLFQVNCVHSAKVNGNLDALFDAETNVRVAYQIYQGCSCWRPWVAYTSGAYLKYY